MLYTKQQNEDMRILSDAIKQDDRIGSLITIENEFGETLHKNLHNKVIISGSAFTIMKHYNKNVPVKTPTYNSVLNLENTINETFPGQGVRREEQVILFAVGTGGWGETQSAKIPVDYTKWIQPDELVPFRLVENINDLSALERKKYFGRKIIDNRIAYYFKAFETDPQILQRYVDGTPIDENIYNSSNTLAAESFVQLKLKVSIDDCREWYRSQYGNLDSAKINTLSLLTAYPSEHDGVIYYQDIRPLTKLNFSTEQLYEDSKALDITYLSFY